MPKIALSDVALKNLKPPPVGQIDYWDDKLPAFGVRLSQGGSRTFVLKRNNSPDHDVPVRHSALDKKPPS